MRCLTPPNSTSLLGTNFQQDEGKGFRSVTVYVHGKWRNLFKEFKKVRQQDRGNSNSGGGSLAYKMWYYKKLEELLRDRAKNGSYKSPPPSPPLPPPPSSRGLLKSMPVRLCPIKEVRFPVLSRSYLVIFGVSIILAFETL